MNQPLILATRASKLALWQSNFIKEQLENFSLSVTLQEVVTKGDRIQNKQLHEIGGKGVFIKEIEKELLEHRADLAMHSLKDLPVHLDDRLEIAAVPPRSACGDIMIINPKSSINGDLPKVLDKEFFAKNPQLTIATGSLRRKCLLLEANPNITVVPIRGNVDTRIEKLKNSDWDTLILAEASWHRLGGFAPLSYRQLEPHWFVPSPCQGILAVETRKGQEQLALIRKINCSRTMYAAQLERKILELLGADCTLPVGINCSFNTLEGNADSVRLSVETVVLDLNGHSARFSKDFSFDPEEAPATLAKSILSGLISHGVNQILQNLGLAEVSI